MGVAGASPIKEGQMMITELSLPYLTFNEGGEMSQEKARLINVLEIARITPVTSSYTQSMGLTLSFTICHRSRGENIVIGETLPKADVTYLAQWHKRAGDGLNKAYAAMFNPCIFMRKRTARKVARQIGQLQQLRSDLVLALDMETLRANEPVASEAYIRLRDRRNALILEIRKALKSVPPEILYHRDIGADDNFLSEMRLPRSNQ